MSSWHEGMTVIEKWQQTGLLRGLAEDKVNLIAHALESQRLFNYAICDENDSSKINMFKRISIPVVRRVFPFVNFEATENQSEHLTPFKVFDYEGNHCLDKEAEKCAILAEDLKEYLNKFSTVKFHALSFNKDNFVVFHGELA